LSVPLALASPAAYLAGVAWMPGTGSRMMAPAAVLLIMVAGVHSYGRRTLYRRAAAADAALDEADRTAREQYVILSRNIERREHERLLHDTVLNTLTALARAAPGDGDDVAGAVYRCRQDVILIEAALRDPDPDGSTVGHGDLVHGVRGVAAEMRARGLDVHVEVTGGVPAIPAPVVTALANATREALSNVAAHAGTTDAWVEVSRIGLDRNAGAGKDGAGKDGAGEAGAQVTVRDQGAGFDPARVDRARLGLRRSITERVADCGGQASVWSAPGQGTVIRMSWSEPEPGTRGALTSAAQASATQASATESSPW
jgi:signal transduction histidine kinase